MAYKKMIEDNARKIAIAAKKKNELYNLFTQVAVKLKATRRTYYDVKK
jgi:hypothetical protein